MPTLANRVYDAAHLTGTFTLRSGTTSNEYFDKYRFEADPVLLRDIAEAMAPLVPDGIDALAGLELGGVPIATALSLHTGIPARFVRKEAKTYGTCLLAEGGDIEGMRLLVVEDVVTTGGQVLLSTADLRQRGAKVDTVRTTQRNVKHWSSGEMGLRWTAAGMLEAEKQFRKIIGYTQLPQLAIAIERRLHLSPPNTVTTQEAAIAVTM